MSVLKADANPKQSFNGLSSKYADLSAGLIVLSSALVVFIFFINLKIDPTNNIKINFEVKPEYASWAWVILTLSSMLYYFIRSNGKTTSGGYMNPLFKWLLKFARIFPFVGLVLSGISGTGFVFESQLWNDIITASYRFLNSMLILFVVAYFGSGIASIKRYWKEK